MREINKDRIDNILINQARPENCSAILLSMKKGDLRDEEEILKKIKMRNVNIGRKIYLRRNLYRLDDLGLLNKIKKGNKVKGYELTKLGQKSKELLLSKKNLFYDFMHHLHMKSAFEENKDGYFLTYYLILKDIYNRGKVRDYNTIISDVFEELGKILGENVTHDKGQDNTSVGKALAWVKKPLSPPFLDKNKEVNYRKNVDPLVFLMSISGYYFKEGIPHKNPIMLNEETKKEISIMGLLDEKYFSDNIGKMSNLFEEIYIKETVNGKTITLRKKFNIEDKI